MQLVCGPRGAFVECGLAEWWVVYFWNAGLHVFSCSVCGEGVDLYSMSDGLWLYCVGQQMVNMDVC